MTTTIGKYKVLIVDDDDTVLKVLALTLKRSGMNVLTTTSPKEALGVIRAQPLDIVISDVRMPEMSGLDLLKILREEGILTPFVIISSQSSRDVLLDSLRMGAFDLISKPMQASIISRLMDEAIRFSQRQKHIALVRPQATETAPLDMALAWTLANVTPLASFKHDRLDQKTLDILAEKDARKRTIGAALLAMQSTRTPIDNLRNFQGRAWDLGVLVRIFHGLRASFEALGEAKVAQPLATFEASFAWLRVRPEDLAADMAGNVANCGESMTKLLKVLAAGGSGDAELAELAREIGALDARIQKSQQRAAS